METLIGRFNYPGVIITWTSEEYGFSYVKKHIQLDYEEGSFENQEPTIFITDDVVKARDTFLEWVSEFVSISLIESTIKEYMPM